MNVMILASTNVHIFVAIVWVTTLVPACPKGYHGDGRRNGQGCILDKCQSSMTTVLTAGKK